MNEIELKQKFDVLIPNELLEEYEKLAEIKARFGVVEEEIRSKMTDFLVENNLAEYKQGRFSFVAVPSYEKKTVDTKKMKEEGIYDLYTKTTIVKPSLRININYEDE